jgi:hypothetical protein
MLAAGKTAGAPPHKSVLVAAEVGRLSRAAPLAPEAFLRRLCLEELRRGEA